MLQKILIGPTFPDVDKTRKARLLHIISVMVLIIIGFVALSTLLFTSATSISLSIITVIAVTVIVQLLLWRGSVLLASWLLIGALWSVIALSVLAVTGIQGRYFSSFTMVVFLAFALLPKRNWLIVVVLSCLVGIGATYLQEAGIEVAVENYDGPLVAMFTQIGSLLVAVILFASTYNQTNRLLRQSETTNAELEQTNIALKASEASLRSLIENASDAILVLDIDKMCTIEVNQQATFLFGYSRDDLINLPLLNLLPKQQPDGMGYEFLNDVLDNVLSSGVVMFEWAHLHSSGRQFMAEVRMTHLPSDTTRLVRASIVDITERKATEHVVQQSLHDLQNLHQITANMQLSAQEKIEQLLQLGRERFGFPMAALTELVNETCQPNISVGISEEYCIVRPAGDTFHAILQQTSEPLCIVNFADSAEYSQHPMHTTQQFQSLYAAAIRASGDYYGALVFVSLSPRQTPFQPMDIELIKLMAQWIGSEVSRQKAEDAQNVAMERLRLVTDNMPGRIGYADAEQRIIFINNRLGEQTIDPEIAVGQTLIEMYEPSVYEGIKPYIERVLLGEHVSFEEVHPRDDGTAAYSSVIYVPHFEDDVVIGFFAMAIDVTQLRETERALNAAQKMESLGVLAGGIAHDFNNLLVAMLGQNSLAQAKLSAEHPAYRHVTKAISASKRAASLTQQMLAYSGRGQFEIRRINMNHLMRDNLDLFVASIPKRIALKSDFYEELPVIEADSAQMQQVAMNLIINAAQAIGDNAGTVTITTGVQTISEQNKAFWQYTGDKLESGHYVSLEVQDDGIGMDAETRECIFDPFFTTKPAGSGLGLAAVVGIMRGHGGGIHVYSEVGQGTVFKLLFRVAETFEPIMGKMVVSAETLPSYKKITQSVLVIDDEPLVLDLVTDILDAQGIPSITAASGREGIARYREQQNDISLVLLDLSMPGLNGGETYQLLREINPDVSVILSSGYNQHEATRSFIGRELVGFVQKPYDAQTLATKIQAHLNLAAA